MENDGHRFYPQLSVDSLYTAFVQEYDAHFRFQGESHEMWELVYILEGAVGFTSGTQLYECRAGELVIHPGGMFHTSWALNNERIKLLTISFTGDGVSRVLPGGKFAVTPFEETMIALLCAKFPEVCVPHTAICREIWREDIPLENGQILKNLLIRHAVKLLGQDLSMREIAEAMNFSSQNYFSAFFQARNGTDTVSLQGAKAGAQRTIMLSPCINRLAMGHPICKPKLGGNHVQTRKTIIPSGRD